MNQHESPMRRQLRLRSLILAVGAALVTSFMVGAIGLIIHSAYTVLRHDRVTPVQLMALDNTEAPINIAIPAPLPASSFVPNRSVVGAAGHNTPARSAAAPIRQSAMPRRMIVRDTRPMFDGRPIHLVGSVRMLVTAYSPDRKSCGIHAHGITASGYSVWTNAMKLVAADARLLPFGALISVPEYNDGRPVPVLDRGGAIKGRHVDVLLPTDREARSWGKRYMTVTVWDYD